MCPAHYCQGAASLVPRLSGVAGIEKGESLVSTVFAIAKI
jgi:hypothetical protein